MEPGTGTMDTLTHPVLDDGIELDEVARLVLGVYVAHLRFEVGANLNCSAHGRTMALEGEKWE